MSKVYVSYNNIVSAFGFESEAAIKHIEKGVSGLKLVDDTRFSPEPFYTSLVDQENFRKEFANLRADENFTRLEQMMLVSLNKVISESNMELTDKVGLIVSTTKGNIDVLEEKNTFPHERAYLSQLGTTLKRFFGFKNEPIVLSNACVSGILAIAVAKRLINQGRFDHVFVVGGDLVTRFIVSGFNSLQAMSNEPCRPYCKTRSGINIGEVVASALITNNPDKLAKESVVVVGEASCNDANHISGPSRTGEGLYRSVKSALKQSKSTASKIDYISAHGTATPFNDEMEAIAFDRLGMNEIPLNSLKGYFGHTLGASGLVETTLFASYGFKELGVSKAINVIQENTAKELRTFLKTASGFGGCNTAILFQKAN